MKKTHFIALLITSRLLIDLETNEGILVKDGEEVFRGDLEEIYKMIKEEKTFKSVEEAGYARKVVISRKNGKDYVAIRNGKGLELIYKL